MHLKLFHANTENGILEHLLAEWEGQLKGIGEELGGYYAPYIDQTRKIVSEDPPDERYKIYVLKDDTVSDEIGYAALAHFNHAWPKASYATLRITTAILAPKYDDEGMSEEDAAEITASLLFGGYNLCQNEMLAKNMKVHLSGLTDRKYALGIATAFKHTKTMPAISVSVKGNWLEIAGIPHEK